MTVTELKGICDGLSITYATNDVKDKLIALIAKNKGISYVESDLTSKTLANLQAICDGLEITYTPENTEDELKAKILA